MSSRYTNSDDIENTQSLTNEEENTTDTSEDSEKDRLTDNSSEDNSSEDNSSEDNTSDEEDEENEEESSDEEPEELIIKDNKKPITQKLSPKYLKVKFSKSKDKNTSLDKLYNQFIKLLNSSLYDKNKDNKELITNQRVSSPSGAYIIPDDKYDEFLNLYASIVENEEYINNAEKFMKYKLNIGERQCEVGPLLIDLDFKYKELPNNVSRIYHMNDLLNKVMDIIENKLKYYFIIDKYDINGLLFEKPTPTKIEKEVKDKDGNIKKETYFKDGVHIVYDLPIKKVDRHFLYRLTLQEINITGLFNNLPTDDTPETILDESTISRNCWMMYGSTKIEKDKTGKIHIRPQYKLTQTRSVYDLLSVKQLSVRKYKYASPLEVKDEIYDEYLIKLNNISILKREGLIKSKTPALVDNKLNETISTEINTLCSADYKFTNEEQERIEWARCLLKIINPKRADNYQDWLYIGWALHNTHTSLFEDYINWSKQSINYNEEECLKNWKTCKSRGKVCSIKTLELYAQRDNPKEYDNLFNDIYQDIIEKALEGGTIQKESMIPFTKFGNLYLAVSESLKKRSQLIIYRFNGKRWIIDQNGRHLIPQIQRCQTILEKRKAKFINDYIASKSEQAMNTAEEKLTKEFNNKINELNKEKNKKVKDIDNKYDKTIQSLNKKINESTNSKNITKYSEEVNDLLSKKDEEINKINEEYKKLAKQYEIQLNQNKKDLKKNKTMDDKDFNKKKNKYQKVINDFDNIADLNNGIVKQFLIKTQISLDKFNKLMDQKKNLLGVKNGIIDLDSANCFREGNPSDFVSLSMGCKYNPNLTWESEYVKKFLNYIYSLQLKKENAEYLLRVLGSCLYGRNDDNKIFFFYGKGSNGKSGLMKFLTKLFTSNYCTISNYSMLTQKKGKSADASPDMIRLKHKRLVVMDEANNTDLIQTAIMKRLTGNDTIVARGLFEDESEFDPQFKIIITCNDMPPFDNADFSVSRRVVKFNFDVKFVNPKEKRKEDFESNEREADPDIEKYLLTDEMLEAGLWVLVQKYKEYKNIGYKPPEDVQLSTRDYKIEGNKYLQFLKYYYTNDTENVNKDGINVNDMYKNYKKYCTSNDIFNKINKNEFIHQLELLSTDKEILSFEVVKDNRNTFVKGLIAYTYDSEYSVNSNYSNTTTPSNAIEELNEKFNNDTKSEELNNNKKSDKDKDSKSETNIKLNK